jgi:hypothetical protein
LLYEIFTVNSYERRIVITHLLINIPYLLIRIYLKLSNPYSTSCSKDGLNIIGMEVSITAVLGAIKKHRFNDPLEGGKMVIINLALMSLYPSTTIPGGMHSHHLHVVPFNSYV